MFRKISIFINLDQYPNNFVNNMNQSQAENFLNNYLTHEGIDRRYSQLIAKELLDATEMTNEQLNRAAGELEILNKSPRSDGNNSTVKTNNYFK